MNLLKIANIHTLVTMDDEFNVLHDVDVLVRDGRIEAVGRGLAAPEGARVLDGRWCVASPASSTPTTTSTRPSPATSPPYSALRV